MAATSACDDGEWSREALLDPDLVAAVILSFRQQNRHDPAVGGDAGPSTYAPTRPLEWGRRIKRSRMMNIPRIFPTTEEEEEEEEQLERKGKRRASPQSPLEGYSSASASVEEDRPRDGRSTGVCVTEMEERLSKGAVVVAATNLRAPEASMNPASCHARVRRPSSKKWPKVELQTLQVALIQEKAKILQEIDKWRITLEKLRVENGQLQVKGLPFNRYTWLVTHNSFSIVDEPSSTGVPRVTFYNQEDTVTNQLRNGVRGLMLDMYDFENDIWLCHSFQGQCYNFTAFEPAINTLKEVEAFLSQNPSEIVTIIIEDYVHAPKGLSKLFADAGLVKFWYPVSEMPRNGMDWPSVTDMVSKNHRLLVFTSDASKESSEGIAFQWHYFLENEAGDPGILPGSCPNRKESQPLNSRYASLFLQNYFPTMPFQNEACKEHSVGLAEMVDACFRAAGNTMPNFIAVNFYMRSNGGGVFDIQDRINGLSLCGCNTITACQAGAATGVCKNTGSSNLPSTITGGTYSGYVELSGSVSLFQFSVSLVVQLVMAVLLLHSLY